MTDEDDFVRITLRIPKKLHADLTEVAAKKRSMNAEIIARLEASFQERPAGGLFGLGGAVDGGGKINEISENTRKIIEILMRDTPKEK